MNIGVCIKVVSDYEIPADKFELENNRIAHKYKEVIGLYDEHAIEVGLQLKSELDSKLYIISVGKQEQIPVLKKGLSMGGDELILVDSTTDDPFLTAYNLANTIKKYDIDVVILGKISSDLEREIVPPLLAEMLDRVYIPYVTTITTTNTNDGKFLLSQQLDNKSVLLKATNNFVASIIDSPINLPRIPNLKEIMKSKTKPIHIESEEKIDNFEWTQEISVGIPHYEYVNEFLSNEDLAKTANLLIEKLKKEHCL